ncbi:MAG: hypothetical protein JWM47_3366 [Acidimicrobiales bacterium]|nr:hypothetical protein [Acidimicrobiales bacterium]
MRQRILAGIAAVALILVAVVVRAQLADGGSSGGGREAGGKPVVACTPDLQPVCDALVADGRIAAGTDPIDLDRGAADPDPAVDGWITWDPAPGIANFDADAAGVDKPWGRGRALGSSALAVAIRATGGPQLPAGCTQIRFTWPCLTDATASSAPQPVGVGDGTTAESLARLHPLALTLLDDPSLGFDQIDSGGLRRLITSPVDGQDRFPDQLRTLRTAPGVLDFVVGPAGAMDVSGVVTLRPASAGAVVVVLAPRADGDEDLLQDAFGSERVEQALRDTGVEPGSGTLAPDERAGDLYAVRDKVG